MVSSFLCGQAHFYFSFSVYFRKYTVDFYIKFMNLLEYISLVRATKIVEVPMSPNTGRCRIEMSSALPGLEDTENKSPLCFYFNVYY